MSDPIIDALNEFRADVGEPTDAQRARAFERATSAREQVGGANVRGRRWSWRGSRGALAIGGAAVALAAVIVLLVAPGLRGPAAPSEAQAATIVRRVIAAVTPSATGILHVRYVIEGVPFPGAGHVVRATVESWSEIGGDARFRQSDETIVPGTPIEIASSGSSSGFQLFDPRTDAIYQRASIVMPVGPSSSARALSTDFATKLRDQLQGVPLADNWKVVRTKLDGRDVYSISNLQNSRSGPTGITYYADAETFLPVQIEEPGMPKNQPGGPRTAGRGFSLGPHTPASLTTTRILTFETLDATYQSLANLDLARAHPGAQDEPVSRMRADLRARVQEGSPVTTVPASPPAQSGSVARITVDPTTGSLDGFQVGDKLLALSPLLGGPPTGFPVLPGNLRDAAVTGLLDRNGILVVTFRDAAEEHSTSAYLNRPFKTSRGDVNSVGTTKGTTLGEFLQHWPDHGAPVNIETGRAGTVTTMKVGQATFFFNTDNRLSAVSTGDGDAASYAGFGG